VPALPLFSGVESYQPATVAGLVCLEFVWGTAFPPPSRGAPHTSATVASLVHPKLAGGSHQTHLLWQAYLLKVRLGACPFSFVRSTQGAPSFCYVSFSVPCCFNSVFFVFPREGLRLSRGLGWFIPGVAIGIPHAVYLLTCWSESPKQGRSQHLVAWEASWFLHIVWCGEVMCRLGAQGCQNFASSWWYFLPGMSPASQQDFCFTELTLSASSL
jgi:hypothetical protein